MDAQKKQHKELKIVLALVAVLGLTGARGALQLFGARKAAPIVTAPGAARVPAAVQAVPQPAEAHSRRVRSSGERTGDGTAAYTAGELRDPLASLLPKEPPAPEATPSADLPARTAVQRPTEPPAINLRGIIWGEITPLAIIDDRLYRVGDPVEGARIITIDRSGMTVEYEGVAFPIAVVTAGTAAPSTSYAGRRSAGPWSSHGSSRSSRNSEPAVPSEPQRRVPFPTVGGAR